MSEIVSKENFEALKKYLPTSFRPHFNNEIEDLTRAYPLLSMLCDDQALLDPVRAIFEIAAPVKLSDTDSMSQALALLNRLLPPQVWCTTPKPLFVYRLPVIQGEFPVHSREINQAIAKFNSLVESFHETKNDGLNPEEIEAAFKNILVAINKCGRACDQDSIWQLLSMMSGWLEPAAFQDLFKEFPYLLYPGFKCQTQSQEIKKEEQPARKENSIKRFFSTMKGWLKSEDKKAEFQASVTESEEPIPTVTGNSFVPNYNYNFNRAGRLANETHVLLLNAFGMKLGGHFDAQTKHVPRFISIEELKTIIHRQLSHRIDIPNTPEFDTLMINTLVILGMRPMLQDEKNNSSREFINPFTADPLSFLNPEKIKQVIETQLHQSTEFKFESGNVEIISQYLFELLQSFQFNPGQALGIGANWDGTVSLSNESGVDSFKLVEAESAWGKRFKEISLHRQGPSEALMDVMTNGLKFEFGTIFTDFDYMSRLQPSERAEVVRNAIIDNLVTELFPETAYHENEKYEKYQKRHVVREKEDGERYIDHFYQPNTKGTYFGKNGDKKQTPMYRRAGTLDVQPFPRKVASAEGSRESYANNPLVPFQVQYGQSMYRCTRGHIVYDPKRKDQFIPDAYYGQVLQSENGDYTPYIGHVPTNLDREFGQESELCASFVVRMLQSSRLIEYCPTFRDTVEQIKTGFLPDEKAVIPPLPAIFSSSSIQKILHTKLGEMIASKNASFNQCQKVFYSLFKNIIYQLYEFVKLSEDKSLRARFIQFMTTPNTFDPPSRATADRILRELTINKPVSGSPAALKKYEESLSYLTSLVGYFYPKPTHAVAKKIAEKADAYVKPLLASPSVQRYFAEQQKSPQTNLSRKTTPGSLYHALKNGEIKNVWEHQKTMHEKNTPSGYRDTEGNQLITPETWEENLDKAAKVTGGIIDLMKKHDVIFGASKIISEPIIHSKQAYATHTHHKALHGVWGGVQGFFKGTAKVAFSVPLAAVSSVKWIHEKATHKSVEENVLQNPLAISAAPPNEPGLKVKIAMKIRNYLLGLLTPKTQENDIDQIKNEIIKQFIDPNSFHFLYPDINDEGMRLLAEYFKSNFPDKLNWDNLLNPFQGLLDISFLNDSHAINTLFVQALFACLMDKRCADSPKKVVETYFSFYSLNPNQKKVLQKFVDHYNLLGEKEKNAFLKLFEFNGDIQKALNARDQAIQQIQNWSNAIFNEQFVHEILFEKQLASQEILLSDSAALISMIDQMPENIKLLVYKIIKNNSLSFLDEYELNQNLADYIKSFHAIFNQLNENDQKKVLTQFEIQKKSNENVLSEKDKAHDKWTAFTEKELRHALLEIEEVNAIFSIVSKKLAHSPEIIEKLNELKNIYSLYFTTSANIQNDRLDLFYAKACDLLEDLAPITTTDKEATFFQESKNLLQNFLDVTMNRIVNARLDSVDVLSTADIENPLLASKAIALWLNELNNNKELRSLLSQQLEESPSLDHVLWRDKCILQVVEQKSATVKIHKTGIQSLLRFWFQHNHNITRTGDIYRVKEHNVVQPKKVSSTSLLFDDCRTMQLAIHRVESRVNTTSLCRDVEYKKYTR